MADRRVRGPILTTQSEFDTAVGRWYPLAAGAARQVSFAPGELPKYGAVGTFGLRGLDSGVVNLGMLPADAPYGFEPGTIYNIESSGIIREGGRLLRGPQRFRQTRGRPCRVGAVGVGGSRERDL